MNLDQKQPGFPEQVLPEYLTKIGVPFHILEQDTYSVVKRVVPEGKTTCGLCSRLRRGALYTFAAQRGVTKIALGHHRGDGQDSWDPDDSDGNLRDQDREQGAQQAAEDADPADDGDNYRPAFCPAAMRTHDGESDYERYETRQDDEQRITHDFRHHPGKQVHVQQHECPGQQHAGPDQTRNRL